MTCPAAAAGLTLAAGGTLKQALFAAAITFAQMGVYDAVGGIVAGVAQSTGSVAATFATKIATHAIVGGAFSVAQGGSFETGALTGAVAAGASFLTSMTPLAKVDGIGGVAARTAIAAVAGGTASVLAGGKFANGAITGAMGYLYNMAGATGGHVPKMEGCSENCYQVSHFEGLAIATAPLGILGAARLAGFAVGAATRWAGAQTGADLGLKLEFLLGNATGSAHNIERSRAMYSQLQRIGLHDSPATRKYLVDHLNTVLRNSSSIVRTQANGRVVRESLLIGPRGGVKLESIWEGGKLVTPKIFGR